MAGFYDEMRDMATELLGEFKQGRVTIVRTTQADKPVDWPTWEPWTGATTTAVYELDAVVKGVSAKLIDGVTILATDLELICSHRMVQEGGGATADFDASLLDTLNIDGKPVTIMRDLTVPGAGMPVAHRYIIRG